MKQYIAISAIGNDRVGLVHDLSKVIADCGGNISESRMTALGSEFAMLMLIAGNWHSVARIETELKKLAETSGITLQVRRTDERAVREDQVPYSVDVVCLDQAGIISALSGFFSARGVETILSELVWVGLPCLALAACAMIARRAPSSSCTILRPRSEVKKSTSGPTSSPSSAASKPRRKLRDIRGTS